MKLSANRLLVILFSILLLGLAGFSIAIWDYMREPTLGGDFTLIHRDKPWKFSDDSRKLNLLYFGYVKCPDVCPMSLSNAGQAFKKLDVDELKNVRLAFASVDVSHDTPQSVADYANQFYPSFVGLTGSEIAMQEVVALFGASFMTETDAKSYLGYSIIHTDRLFFLNRKGIVIDTIQSPRSADLILAKIKEHL